MTTIAHPTVPDLFLLESQAEETKAAAFYADSANAGKTYDFCAYKNLAGIKALQEAFDGKCAYCETRYAAASPMDVEHYRPKGAIVIDGKLEKPGYWWLAANWDNLLPSCIDCNRARTQELPDTTTRVLGKANKFPLKDETKRARNPGEQPREEPLLLNPCANVEIHKHLKFDDSGVVTPLSEEGRVTEETVGLNRKELVLDRKRRIIEIQHQIQVVKTFLKMAKLVPEGPGRDELKANIREEIAFLKSMVNDKAAYAALGRALVNPFIQSLGI